MNWASIKTNFCNIREYSKQGSFEKEATVHSLSGGFALGGVAGWAFHRGVCALSSLPLGVMTVGAIVGSVAGAAFEKTPFELPFSIKEKVSAGRLSALSTNIAPVAMKAAIVGAAFAFGAVVGDQFENPSLGAIGGCCMVQGQSSLVQVAASVGGAVAGKVLSALAQPYCADWDPFGVTGAVVGVAAGAWLSMKYLQSTPSYQAWQKVDRQWKRAQQG